MNKISKRSNYFSSIFHLLIIAMFLLGLSGCGYKAPPIYLEDAPEGDENVELTSRIPANISVIFAASSALSPAS